ncbi:hypothetical protein [Streptomyces sp. RKND-216]|uniref:hypothetical protein n=1 Tax=Streptomyces sp. RKND-216 TaxID=2562581 RepID=UPI001446E66C|nr:hypothetical protein [Streptomyces sp. RKND-216]
MAFRHVAGDGETQPGAAVVASTLAVGGTTAAFAGDSGATDAPSQGQSQDDADDRDDG